VVIAIISLLVSILLPSLTKARELARMIACQSNQRNLGMGVQYFFEENDQYFPRNNTWSGQWLSRVAPYLDIPTNSSGTISDYNNSILHCPSSDSPLRSGSKDYKPGALSWVNNGFHWGTIGYERPDYQEEYPQYTMIARPLSDIIFVVDGKNDGTDPDCLVWRNYIWRDVSDRHMGNTNILWLDWHVGPKFFDDLDNEDFYLLPL
jgi:prepilin-type processing-associated H-X9-DG protein